MVAIAMVHSDNRLTSAIALTLFATGIALSLLLIAAYSRPFTGEISVRPDLLRQVITNAPSGHSSVDDFRKAFLSTEWRSIPRGRRRQVVSFGKLQVRPNLDVC